MASKLNGIELARYDDLFKTETEREADRQERIQIIPATEVFPYSRQPYTVDRPTPDLMRLIQRTSMPPHRSGGGKGPCGMREPPMGGTSPKKELRSGA